MTAPMTVPLTISPDAAARVAELGMQAEFERMLDRIRQTVPDLERIDVWLQPPYDTGDEPGVIIEAYRTEPDRLEDERWKQWADWVLDTFSPDVWRHFTMWTVHDPSHAR